MAIAPFADFAQSTIGNQAEAATQAALSIPASKWP
jgi:hypothetical protein